MSGNMAIRNAPVARFALWLLTALILHGTPAAARPIVVFLSDFGATSEAPALCHGAILSVDPEIEVVDLTHAVRPYDIRQGAEILGRATTFPKGTVFFGVVDPGVGTKRQAIAICTKDSSFFIAPDNGLLSTVIRTRGVAAAVRIDPARVNPAWKPGTFDGRDLFAPAAAILAQTHDLTRIGQPCDPSELILLELPAGGTIASDGSLEGTYTRTDEPYGNIWTDLDRGAVLRAGIKVGTPLEIAVGTARIRAPLVTAFGDVSPGQALAYFNSEDRLAFALNLGNLRDSLRVSEGSRVTVRRAGPGR
jgi:S-adenosyl-L-methionine hydrolase (adenosine-forming)